MKRRDFNKLAACAVSVLSIGQLPQLPKKGIYQERLLIDYAERKNDEYGEIFRRVFENNVTNKIPLFHFVLNKLYLKSNGELLGRMYIPRGSDYEALRSELRCEPLCDIDSKNRNIYFYDLNWKIYQYSPTGDVIKVLTKEDFRI